MAGRLTLFCPWSMLLLFCFNLFLVLRATFLFSLEKQGSNETAWQARLLLVKDEWKISVMNSVSPVPPFLELCVQIQTSSKQ